MRYHIASYEWCGCTSDEQYLCWRSPLYIHNCARSSSIFTSIETGEGELRKAGWWIGELDVMWWCSMFNTARSARHAHAQETQRRSAGQRSTQTVFSMHAAGYEYTTTFHIAILYVHFPYKYPININISTPLLHLPFSHHGLSIRSHLHPCSVSSFTNSS